MNLGGWRVGLRSYGRRLGVVLKNPSSFKNLASPRVTSKRPLQVVRHHPPYPKLLWHSPEGGLFPLGVSTAAGAGPPQHTTKGQGWSPPLDGHSPFSPDSFFLVVDDPSELKMMRTRSTKTLEDKTPEEKWKAMFSTNLLADITCQYW